MSDMDADATSFEPPTFRTSPGGELVVGCSDAVYLYNEEGRGACFAFAGAKQLLLSFRGYLLVVVGGGGGGGGGGHSGSAQLSVYDVANHLTAHAMKVTGVAHVLCDAAAVTIVLVRVAYPVSNLVSPWNTSGHNLP